MILKKKALWLIATSMLVIAAISGTTAYFTKEFTSDNNVATAAAFDVDVVDESGNTIANGQFHLDGDLYPGMETIVAYQFDVKRNQTELPFEYSVDLTGSGDLFPDDGSSPITLTLQKQEGDSWVDIDYDSAFVPSADVETYRILVDWPHGENDIDFQGLTGTLALNVVATQIDYSSKETAEEMYEAAREAYEDLDRVRDTVNRGNFTKEQSDAVQAMIDDLFNYINGMKDGDEKDEMLGKAEALQNDLDAKVESRYVYYSIKEDETNFTQIVFENVSAEVSTQTFRYHTDKPLHISALIRGDDKVLRVRYFNSDVAEVGDRFELGMRFSDGTKPVDYTLTNLGDGEWKIESDWLIPYNK